MTIETWLSTRKPPPPAALMDSLKTALGPSLGDDADEAAQLFLLTAERMLRELVAAGETGRSTADALLTIDALTTYALESAAETVRDLPGFSDDAIARLASALEPEGDATEQ